MNEKDIEEVLTHTEERRFIGIKVEPGKFRIVFPYASPVTKREAIAKNPNIIKVLNEIQRP